MTTIYLRRCGDPKAAVADLKTQALRALGLPDLPLLHDGAGRPYLEGGPFVSVSHSRNYCALALSDRPVGLDAEELRPLREKLAARVMGPEEYRWYRARGSREEDFFTLWTLKESWLKYLGTGLRGFPNDTAFVLEDGIWRLRGSGARFHTVRKGPLFLALCGEEQEAPVMKRTD